MRTRFILLSTLTFVSCKNITQNEVKNNVDNDTIQFKEWLVDTLHHLKYKPNNGETSLFFPNDSTYLRINKNYNRIIDTKKQLNNKDLEIAVYLLKENDTLPAQNFNLTFHLSYYYDIGYGVPIYESTFEINKFIVKTHNQEIKYNFIKGNLIDKKISNF